jgi:hypothetical protein
LSYRTRQRLLWLFWTAAILTPFVTFVTSYRASRTTGEFTVDRRERVTSGRGDSSHSYYLVWALEGEVFMVADSWSFLQWDSSDRYGRLKEGKRFRALVAGWRIGFLSWYRNIIEIEEVAPPDVTAERDPK